MLQSIIGSNFQDILFSGLSVESLGECQLSRGRMKSELTLAFVLELVLAGRVETKSGARTWIGPMIRYQGVSQGSDRIRIVRFQDRDNGVRRRLLGDFEFPGAGSPGRCHVILV